MVRVYPKCQKCGKTLKPSIEKGKWVCKKCNDIILSKNINFDNIQEKKLFKICWGE